MASLLSENDARELTAQIFGHIDAAWEKIKQAYYGRADLALGYASWDDYCIGEFHGAQLRLPRDKRREAVATLTEAGLSQRAIASATGASKNTVIADQKLVQIGPVTPDVPDLDGKVRRPAEPSNTTIIIDGAFSNTIPGDKPKPIVKAVADTRPLLVKKADAAAWDLRKAVEKIADVRADESYPVHHSQIALSLTGAIEFARSVLLEMD